MNDPYPVGSDHARFALKEAVKGLSGASLRSAAHARFDVLVERGRQPCGGSRRFRSSADASGRVAARKELTFLATSFWSFM
jgi:hypothetical protein